MTNGIYAMFATPSAKSKPRFFIAWLLGLPFVMSHAPLQAGVFDGRPDVLVCSVDDPSDVQAWDQIAFYVSARLEDGGVLYKSLTSNPVLLIVSMDGLVEARNLADCDGRTVTELRDEGRAFDFPARS